MYDSIEKAATIAVGTIIGVTISVAIIFTLQTLNPIF